MANTGLAVRNTSMARRREMKSTGDRTLKESILSLKQSSDELDGLEDSLKSALDLPNDRVKGFMARCMQFLVPKSFYPSLPDGLVRYMAEESDVLELIGSLQKQNLNNTQEAVRDLAVSSMAKKEEMDGVSATIKQAKEENWNAQQLQEYIAGKAGIQIYEEISMLLESEFDMLGEEERELKKQQLLDQLEANIVAGQKLVGVMRATCSAGVSILHRAVGHYFDYVTVYRPVADIRDAAKILTDTNTGMYVAKDAVVTTFQASIDAIRKSVRAAQLVSQYSLVSGDMTKMLDEAQGLMTVDAKALTTSLPKQQKALPTIEVVAVETGPDERGVTIG